MNLDPHLRLKTTILVVAVLIGLGSCAHTVFGQEPAPQPTFAIHPGDPLPLQNIALCSDETPMRAVLEAGSDSYERGTEVFGNFAEFGVCLWVNHPGIYRLDEVRPGSWHLIGPDGKPYRHYLARLSYIGEDSKVATAWTFLSARLVEKGLDAVQNEKDA